MELAEWCRTLKQYLKELSRETCKTVPYMVNDLLDQCERAAAGEPGDDADVCVKIALVGTFSSGKSSFLNAVFDRDLTAVAIEQTTRCRTDFTYGPVFRITNIRSGEEITLEDYQKISRIGHAKEDSHYLAQLPDPRLEGILFMDTPGFDPPKDGSLDQEQQDAAISERAAEDADVVFFLIEAKDGTIREDCLQYMQKLNERTAASCSHPLRIAVILNKADLKMPSARQQIVDDVKAICQKKQINVERFILHTSLKPKKKPDFYMQCQSDIWALVKKYQQEKKMIAGNRHGVWAQLSRQSLIDLRDILSKFVDFKSTQLEKKEAAIEKNAEAKINEYSEAIADRLKDFLLEFIDDNRWHYACNHIVHSSGIFDWDWTKDWKAYITEDKDNVIPSGDTRTGLMQKIGGMLDSYSIPSAEVYAARLLKDMDHLILSVFTEDDGTQHYKRYGRTRTCAVESESENQAREWQKEFYNELENQAPAFFAEHVKNALSSLLAQDEASNKQTTENDKKILRKMDSLLSTDFPSLHEKSAYQHPVLDMSISIQRKYVALIQSLRLKLSGSAADNLLEEIRQLNKNGNLGFSNEDINTADKKSMEAVFAEQSDLQDNQKILLVIWALEDAGFAAADPAFSKKVFPAVSNISLFRDVDTKDLSGIFEFGAYASTAKDEADLAEKALSCENVPMTWAYQMINRGFDAVEYRKMESAMHVFSWKNADSMFKNNNFTKNDEGELLLEKCMWPFDRNAADFLISHGCDTDAVAGDGNVIKNLSMMLSDEAFTYLLDHGVSISKECWDDLFLLKKTELIAIATKRDPASVPPDSVFQGVFSMDLETLKAYGDNGGNLNIYSGECQSSLVDSFVQHDKNNLVEYMRAHGIQPSEDAKSLTQLIDELGQFLK